MSCSNFDYKKMVQSTVRDALTCIDSQGLLLYGNADDIYLVYETEIGGDPALYKKGEIKTKKEKIVPKPLFSATTKLYQDHNVIQKSGEVSLKNVIASDNSGDDYTREQIEGADYFLVGDSEYDLVEGSLNREANGVFWAMMLKRRQVGKRTKR